MSSVEINIRSIQHFMYCPHRWGLLEIDQVWEENMFVTKANLMHERVHNPENAHLSKGKEIYTSIPVYHDSNEYNLFGVLDCLELTEDSNGVVIPNRDKKYKVTIVEYKPTKPKDCDYKQDDLMQVFAQKICVDYILKSDCEAVIYYSDIKRRISLPIKSEFESLNLTLKKILKEMREHLKVGLIPKIRKGQNCNGCSMKDLCMPTMNKIENIQNQILKIQRT